MGAIEVRHFLERAQDFLEGMQLLRDDNAYRQSSALLGIHSAVSYTDALRAGLSESSLSSDDHRNAARELRGLLLGKSIESDNGIQHLEALIAKKSAVAYGASRIGTNEFALILTRAERFARWANRTGSELKIEGWTNGD
ncbi:hypothetical protein SAMN05421819_4374 [Bryocella elongata]|uniref:HEPN domain-containing protein n=1 Tax=Bryocella elongata TaxID=863522 RepID=A0A1H6C9T2_9BACT|nr:hypothetical protein [Bryocella elongata]SEG69721.1 hypothetical protein SAMN05421819_4374 [Bryocella elongata]